MIKFTKMHGIGNDYVYIDCTKKEIKNPNQLARYVSNRNFGVGSDGLILICKSEKADFKMRMFNSDGSEAEMCGNGIRCVSKFVYDKNLTDKKILTIETLGGIKTLELQTKEGKVETVKVDMGEPILEPKEIPVITKENPVKNLELFIYDKVFKFTCVSMGNPHAVTIVDDVRKFNVEKYGELVEVNDVFPKKTNVEFIEVIDRNKIKFRVWERGAGETLACGTGACAAVVSCVLNEITNNKVEVELLGGNLIIEWNKKNNHVYMTGPATTVFEGEIFDEKNLYKPIDRREYNMKLEDILKGIDNLKINGDTDINITKVTSDSRKIKENSMFVAIKGFETDGHKYIPDAIRKGVSAIIIEKGADVQKYEIPKNITVIESTNTRLTLALASANFYKNPSKRFDLIGITGTKGKTTTSYMIKNILEKAGKKVGLIGTIATYIGDKKIEDSERTTPESEHLQELFSKMVEEDVDTVVMEVSSQSLMLDRVAGCNFKYVLFTNFSEDHISAREHKDMEEYFNAKLKLFELCKNGSINIDDPKVCTIEDIMPNSNLLTYGIYKEADLKAENIQITNKEVTFDVTYNSEKENIKIGIPGEFTVYNALAAMSIALKLDVNMKIIKESLKNISVCGRSELVPNKLDIAIMIDYAHSPKSLENILTATKGYVKGRVISVFGCGGDRDAKKRPQMGEISGKIADYTIITSDNPRTEDPQLIVNQIEEGIKNTNGKYECIVDRVEAIEKAIRMANKDDVVILAGKGHEPYQEINHVKYPFDERIIVNEIIEKILSEKK